MREPKQIGRIFAVETAEEGTLLHLVLDLPEGLSELYLLSTERSEFTAEADAFETTVVPFVRCCSEAALINSIKYASNGGVGHG